MSQVAPEMLGEPVANLVRVFHRTDLQQALFDAVGHQNVSLGKTCTHVEQNATGVTAIFADGSRVSGDYLIGADGLNSAVRRYEHRRIERTTKFVRQSRRIGQLGQLNRPVVLTLRNALIKLLPARLQLNQLLGLLAFEPER